MYQPMNCWFHIYTGMNLVITNLVISVPADALAPNGARPSAGTVLTANLDIYFIL